MPTPEQIAELRRKHREQGRLLRQAERAAGITAGDRNRVAAAERSRANSKASAEIGPPPERDEERYERYRDNLFLFLCECFPHSTGLTPLSLDHNRVADRLQESFFLGGRDLIIMSRGFVKSTILELAAVWGSGYGHQPFIVPIGATVDMAKQALESIQIEFETNDHLMAIFPAACHAARALEGIAQRAGKQTINGARSYIEWNRRRCVLPTYPGFAGSGSIVWPRSIKNVRGLRFKRPDGKQQRPTLVLGDDLQTTEGAANPKTCAKIISTLRKDIPRLAGPRSTLAIAVAGTVIERDDAIDQLADGKKFPNVRTLRVPMLKSFSKAHDRWLGKYAEIRTTFRLDDDDDRRRAERDANAEYLLNRKIYDEGCVPAWENRFDPARELSAIQHAYNILIDDGEEAFMAECQGQPVRDAATLEILTADQFCAKQWEFEQGKFPKETAVLTAFVDVHPGLLYSEIWAYEQGFRGGRVDELFFPDQGRKYFGHRTIRRRLKHLFPGLDEEATVVAGLDAFLHGCTWPDGQVWEGLMQRQWTREDGVPMRVRCALVDANGVYRDAIVRVLSRSKFNANLHPSFGTGIVATGAPISAWTSAREQAGVGPEWMFTKPRAGEIVGLKFDANFWKARFYRGFALPRAAQGSLSLPKVKRATDHRMSGDHYASEIGTEVTAKNRTVTEFKQKPNTDNHKLDCAVGAMVAASRCGVTNIRNAKRGKKSKGRNKRKG